MNDLAHYIHIDRNGDLSFLPSLSSQKSTSPPKSTTPPNLVQPVASTSNYSTSTSVINAVHTPFLFLFLFYFLIKNKKQKQTNKQTKK
jgi:hypothetical protein